MRGAVRGRELFGGFSHVDSPGPAAARLAYRRDGSSPRLAQQRVYVFLFVLDLVDSRAWCLVRGVPADSDEETHAIREFAWTLVSPSALPRCCFRIASTAENDDHRNKAPGISSVSRKFKPANRLGSSEVQLTWTEPRPSVFPVQN